MGWLRNWMWPHLSAEERARLDRVAARRAKAQKWLGISILALMVVILTPLVVLWRSF